MSQRIGVSKTVEKCQICNFDQLEPVLFLGCLPPVNSMEDISAPLTEQTTFPLELLRCKQCGHAQIGCEVNGEILFPYTYPYLSGTTKILIDNFRELKEQCVALNIIDANSFVVDIGSNDGTLLSHFQEDGFRVLGIEPSQAGDVAQEKGIETLHAYFSKETSLVVAKQYGKADLVTAANVFAHISDPHEIVEGVIEMLQPEGVFVSESHYLGDLIRTVQYDTIYHEHLRYYHLDVLRHLFDSHGLELFRVERIKTHGGSIRVFAAKKGTWAVDESVPTLLAEETAFGLVDGTAYAEFRQRVFESKWALNALLARLKSEGKRVFGVGAPSRASTLINFVGIDEACVEVVLEVASSHKLNKFIPGTKIPVVEERVLYSEQPDFVLLFSWHIADDLIKNIKSKGFKGQFIIPLPEPFIV